MIPCYPREVQPATLLCSKWKRHVHRLQQRPAHTRKPPSDWIMPAHSLCDLHNPKAQSPSRPHSPLCSDQTCLQLRPALAQPLPFLCICYWLLPLRGQSLNLGVTTTRHVSRGMDLLKTIHRTLVDPQVKKCSRGAGEVAQQIREHTVLEEEPSLIPSTHSRQFTTTCNSNSWRPETPRRFHTWTWIDR